MYDFFGLRVFRNGRVYTISDPGGAAVSDGYVDGPANAPVSRVAVNPLTGTVYSVVPNSAGTPALVAIESVAP